VAIEIVDLPIKDGDFPYKSPCSHGFPWVSYEKWWIFPWFFGMFTRPGLGYHPIIPLDLPQQRRQEAEAGSP